MVAAPSFKKDILPVIFPSGTATLLHNPWHVNSQVAIFLYLIPIHTTVMSILFLDERLRLYQILGGLLIFIGVLLVTHSRVPGKN